MKNKFYDNKAITLIILIITVIVMCILAGVAVSLLNLDDDPNEKLSDQSQVLTDFYGDSSNEEEVIESVIGSDYTQIFKNTVVSNDVEQVTFVSKWNGMINTPNLSNGMVAVYFDEIGQEKVLSALSSASEWKNWYDYSNKKWANAKTSDGSYWVWIPRFAYKITSNCSLGITQGEISIIFVNNKNQNFATTYSTQFPTITNGAMSNYVVHPAFTTNIENGGNEKSIPGFWIAKYEMSEERSSDTGKTWIYSSGANELTKSAGNTSYIRVVSKPNVSSWRNITIGNAYTNSYKYNRDLNSHMIKNSEWGAVSYLAQSTYGRDALEIAKNDSLTYVTRTGGFNASTTGNMSGVFDLNGGGLEFVAAYILNPNGSSVRSTNGNSFATIETATSYATTYIYNTTNETMSSNFSAYATNLSTRYGDAILETSSAESVANLNAWYSRNSTYPYGTTPFLVRGGYNYQSDYSGIFMYSAHSGAASADCGYRTIIF